MLAYSKDYSFMWKLLHGISCFSKACQLRVLSFHQQSPNTLEQKQQLNQAKIGNFIVHFFLFRSNLTAVSKLLVCVTKQLYKNLKGMLALQTTINLRSTVCRCQLFEKGHKTRRILLDTALNLSVMLVLSSCLGCRV